MAGKMHWCIECIYEGDSTGRDHNSHSVNGPTVPPTNEVENGGIVRDIGEVICLSVWRCRPIWPKAFGFLFLNLVCRRLVGLTE
jgi:hypothetical protein